MKHLLILPFILSMVMGTNWAADVWFAECTGTGGAGTSGNPYCTDADSDSIDESFQNAYDGDATITDVNAGDTIWLCCNGGTGQACDVTDSPCTFLLGPSQGANWGPLTPGKSGTSGNPITIQAVSGHTVILSGDHDDDNVFDNGTDITRFMEDVGEDYIEFQCGTNNIIFQETPSHDDGTFDFTNALGWVFNGCTFRADGADAADGVGDTWAYDLEPDNASNRSHIHYADVDGADRGKYFKLAAYTASNGTMTFKNSLFHHIYAFVFRIIVNNNATNVQVIIDNNEFYNTWRVSDQWNNWDWNTGTGLTVTYSNNYMHDNNRGPHWEHLNKGPTVEDNIVLCLGEWQVLDGNANGGCFQGAIHGIENTGGDACSETSGTIVRRNIVGGRVLGDTGAEDCRTDNSGCGWFGTSPITLGPFNCTSSPGPGCGAATGCSGVEEDNIVENNIVLRQWSALTSDASTAGIYVEQNFTGLKIRNNTVYNSAIGIAVVGLGGEISPDIINNLIVKFDKNGTLDMGIKTNSNANGGTTNNNNIYHGNLGTGATIVADMGGTTYDCDNIGNLGSGNICAQPTMIACNDTHNCVSSFSNTVALFRDSWDLHLDSTDSVNIDAGTSTGGAVLDIDKETRDGSPDIGADEFIASGDPTIQGGTLNGVTITQLRGWLDLPPSETNIAYYKFWKARTAAWAAQSN